MFWKLLEFVVFCAIVVVVVGIGIIWYVISDGCGETLHYKIPSPDESKVIYVFDSGCGATTPNSMHYFLDFEGRTDFAERKDLKKRHEFFRHTRGRSYVQWRSETDIEIMYTPSTVRDNFIHKKRFKIKDVRIEITDTSEKSLLR